MTGPTKEQINAWLDEWANILDRRVLAGVNAALFTLAEFIADRAFRAGLKAAAGICNGCADAADDEIGVIA